MHHPKIACKIPNVTRVFAKVPDSKFQNLHAVATHILTLYALQANWITGDARNAGYSCAIACTNVYSAHETKIVRQHAR